MAVNDPWGFDQNDLKEASNSSPNNFEDQFELIHPLSDSSAYIQSLEKRLARIRGGREEPTAREVLKCFSEVREDYASHLVGQNQRELSETFGDAYATDTENGALLNVVSYMERRLFPEKQAVSTEELQRLLDADMLAKTTAEMTSVAKMPETNFEVDACR